VNKAIGAVVVLLGIVFIILLMPNVVNSTTQFRTASQTDPFAATSTAAGISQANITLTQPLWNGQTQYITVTSDNITDGPRVSAYAGSTKVVTVIGLASNISRNLTAVYSIGNLNNYAGADAFAGLSPTMMIVGVLLLAIGAIVFVFVKGKN
jgi:uncharacterized membrane protein